MCRVPSEVAVRPALVSREPRRIFTEPLHFLESGNGRLDRFSEQPIDWCPELLAEKFETLKRNTFRLLNWTFPFAQFAVRSVSFAFFSRRPVPDGRAKMWGDFWQKWRQKASARFIVTAECAFLFFHKVFPWDSWLGYKTLLVSNCSASHSNTLTAKLSQRTQPT